MTQPTRIAQTSREVKNEYKKRGPRFSVREQRQLERGLELDQRAAKAREQEERRRAAKKKREEREQKERQIRKQLGVGLATQLVGYSHTQARMKTGMEAFLGLRKREELEMKRKEDEVRKKLDAIAETMENDPWDDSDDDGGVDLDLPDMDKRSSGDKWIDEDLDDDTLLEAHDLVMSDALEEVAGSSRHQPEPTPSKPTVSEAPKLALLTDDLEFLRAHGPVDKAIEKLLESLPEPLIELLSLDISTNVPLWDPAPSLLHKLNPVGLPPHRLRVKVGCVVELLRDLNTSSQVSRSSRLRVLRVEKERLECIVLDGQLAGTNTILTRVPFAAKYRNENQFPFQRMQFPIRVSADQSQPSVSRDVPQSTFKMPTIPGHVLRLTSSFKKPALPPSRAKPCPNPSFKLPGLPASKTTKTQVPVKQDLLSTPLLLDSWDDFLDSGTQIARELSSDDGTTQETLMTTVAPLVPMIPISTQDLDFSLDDLEEPIKAGSSVQAPQRTPSTSPKKSPRKLPWLNKNSSIASSGSSSPQPHQASKPGSANDTKEKATDQSDRTSSRPRKTSLKHRALPRAAKESSRGANPLLEQLARSPLPQLKQLSSLKRKSPPDMARKSAVKKQALHISTSDAVPTKKNSPKMFGSFGEFGLSTQDVISMFDDDEAIWSSPPIVV